MKKASLLIMFVFFFRLVSQAQSDSIKVDQYCQLIVSPRLLSNKVTIDIDFGNEKNYWRDTRLKTYAGTIRKFNTVIDALNFMGKEGWLFINAYPVKETNTEVYHFAFRKTFLRSDIHN
jgi:hypothetical protein